MEDGPMQDVQSARSAAPRRTGVLLVNTGSPAAPTPEAVRAYLEVFLMDDRIRPLPAPVWRAILDHIILPRRCPASAAKYSAIWTDAGSPLIVGCEALAGRVADVLADDGSLDGVEVRAAMIYGEPSIASMLAGLRDEGCGRLVVLPLYPQSAYSTTAAALDAVDRALARMGWDPLRVAIESYGDDEAYLDAIADSVDAAGYRPDEDYLLFSFHAVPLPDVDGGDTYPDQVRRSARAVVKRLGAADGTWSLSYQSPFEDGRRWTGPNTMREVRELARSERRRLVVACPGFAVDCLETLHDIERVAREEYRAVRAGGDDADLLYVPCLNDSHAHAAVLAGCLRRVLGA